MGNVIKRASTMMWVEWLVNTSHTKIGDVSMCKKTDHGWVDFNRNLFIPTATLRNNNVCEIKDQWVATNWEELVNANNI